MAKYYENQSLEYCKAAIKQSCNDTTASFVKIGYYLKQVRDRELYLEESYQDVWQFAEHEFGISKSTASRFMGINDKFSVDGNSPMLLPEYVGFSSSKLSEMLTLTDKQIEAVTPETTVKEIRQMKPEKPKKRKNGFTHISDDDIIFEIAWELSKVCNVIPDDCRDWFDGKYTDRYINFTVGIQRYYGGVDQDSNKIHVYMYVGDACSPDIEGEYTDVSIDAVVNELVGIKKQKVEPPEVEETKVSEPRKSDRESGVFEDDMRAYGATRSTAVYNAVMVMLELGITEISKPIKCKAFAYEYTVKDTGEYIEFFLDDGRFFDFKTAKKRFAGEYECFRNQEKQKSIATSQQNLKSLELSERTYRTLTSAGISTIEELLSKSDYDLTKIRDMSKKQLDEIHEKLGLREEQKTEEPEWKPHYCAATGNDCNWGEKRKIALDIGMDCKADTMCCCKCEQSQSCGAACNAIHKQPEVVADAKYREVEDNIALKKELLQLEINSENNIMETMRDYWEKEQPRTLIKHETILAALKCYLADIDHFELIEPKQPEQPEQPELPTLTNNDKRKEWIEQYRTWPMWFETEQTGERYYKYDFEDGSSFVVKESLSHCFLNYKPEDKTDYNHKECYHIGVTGKWNGWDIKDRTFYESSTNLSQMTEYLKEIQR